MTVDIATLGIAVDTTQVNTATADLDKLGEAGERSAGKIQTSNRAFTQFNDCLTATEREAQKAAQAAASLRAEQTALGLTTTNLSIGQSYFLDQLRDQANAAGLTRTELLRLRAAEMGVSEAASGMITKIEDATKHTMHFSLQSAGARREIMVLLHELSQGNFKGFGSSMMVLGEQTGAAGLLFSSTGIAALALVAAIGAVGAAAVMGAHEQTAMQNALILTGNYAGATTDSLRAMAQAAVATEGSIGVAKKAVVELAHSGKFTGEQIRFIGEAVTQLEHAAGVSIEKTIKEFESLAVHVTESNSRSSDAISRAVTKLNDEYHFLNEAVFEHIRALEKQGDMQAAATLAEKTYATALVARAHEIEASQGIIMRGWHAVTRGASQAWDAMMGIGRKETPEERVADLQAKLAAKTGRAGEFVVQDHPTIGRGGAVLGMERTKMLGELAKAQAELTAINEKAAAQAKESMVQAAGVHAASVLAQEDAKHLKANKLELALAANLEYEAQIRAANPTSPLITEQAVKDRKTQTIKENTDKPHVNQVDNTQLQEHIKQVESAMAQEKARYDELTRLDQLYHKAGELSDAQFYNSKRDRLAQSVASVQQSLDAEITLLRAHHNTTQEEAAKTHKEITDLMEKRRAVEAKGYADRFQLDEEERLRIKATQSASDDAANKYLSQLQAQALALEKGVEVRQRSKSAVEQETIARYQVAAANMREQAQGPATSTHTEQDIAAAQRFLTMLELELAAHQRIAQALKAQEGQDYHRKAAEQAIQDWQHAGKTIADSISSAFGHVGQALGDMFKIYADNTAAQLEANKRLQESTKGMALDDPAAMAAVTRAQQEGAQRQIKSYGDMTRAAKGFFSEQSKGYRALEIAEKAYRGIELAMALENMLVKSGLLTSFTTLFVSSKALETQATVASVAPDVAASMVKGQAAAAAGVAAQAQGDPYTAWPRMLGMAAAMAALGFAVSLSGSGGVDMAKERQSAAGTGTVLGDAHAKSDSIAKSLEYMAKNSALELSNSGAMLTALQHIESSIAGLGNIIGRDVSLIQPTTQSALGFSPNAIGHAAQSLLGSGSALGSLVSKIPLIGDVVGGLLDKLGSVISRGFGTKNSLQDNGIYSAPQSLAQIQSSGLQASQYAEIESTKKFLWVSYSSQVRTELSALSTEVNTQLSMVIKNLANGTQQATSMLGVSSDAFTRQMQGFVVDLGKVSLKGMTGEQIQKQFEAIFSALGDKMARQAVPELAAFQQVGEGYFQTLMRLATNYSNLDAVLAGIGKTFGALGVASLTARERLIAAAGGIEELAKGTDYFKKNFFTEAEQLRPTIAYVNEQLASLGMAGVRTTAQFKQAVLALDLTTAAGSAQYVALMKLAPAFKQMTDFLEAGAVAAKTAADVASERTGLQDELDKLLMTEAQLLEKQRNALDASNRALFDQVQLAGKVKDARDDLNKAYELEKKNIEETNEKMKSLALNLRSFNDGLLVGNLSPLTPKQKYQEAASQYETTLRAAQSGDTKAQENYQNVANAFLSASKVANASSAQYQADFIRVTQGTEVLAKSATLQVDVGKASLAALNSQVSGLTTINNSVLSVAQAIKALATSMTNAGLSTNNIGEGSSNAISSLYQSLLGRAPEESGKAFWMERLQQGATMGQIGLGMMDNDEYRRTHGLGPSNTIASLYQSILGRAPEESGLQYWLQRLQAGATIGQIGLGMMGSEEYRSNPGLHGSHATGLAYVPFNGYRAQLHQGESVLTASETMQYRQSGTNSMAAMVAEIKALRRANEVMQQELQQLRIEQQSQTGALIAANFEANAQAAQTVTKGMESASKQTAWVAKSGARIV